MCVCLCVCVCVCVCVRVCPPVQASEAQMVAAFKALFGEGVSAETFLDAPETTENLAPPAQLSKWVLEAKSSLIAAPAGMLNLLARFLELRVARDVGAAGRARDGLRDLLREVRGMIETQNNSAQGKALLSAPVCSSVCMRVVSCDVYVCDVCVCDVYVCDAYVCDVYVCIVMHRRAVAQWPYVCMCVCQSMCVSMCPPLCIYADVRPHATRVCVRACVYCHA